jgi:AraC-like DNA-binding protein
MVRREGAVPEVFMEMFNNIISGTNLELSLESLARQYNLHPTYISNKFKSHFGISPIMLSRRVQIQRAIDLLYHQGKPVGEVALALGYKDVCTFTRFFTAQTGTAPSRISQTITIVGITPKYY